MPRNKKTDLSVKLPADIDLYDFGGLFSQSRVYVDRHIQKIGGHFDWLEGALKATEEKLNAIQLNSPIENDNLKDTQPQSTCSEDEVSKRKRRRFSEKKPVSPKSEVETKLIDGQNPETNARLITDNQNTDNAIKIKENLPVNIPINEIKTVKESPLIENIVLGNTHSDNGTPGEVLAESPGVDVLKTNTAEKMVFLPKLNSTFCTQSAISNKGRLFQVEDLPETLNESPVIGTYDNDREDIVTPTAEGNETYVCPSKANKPADVTPGNNGRTFRFSSDDECIEPSPPVDVIAGSNQLKKYSPKVSDYTKSQKSIQENCLSSHLVIAAAANMSETRRRSSLNRIKIRASQEFLKEHGNLDPITIEMKTHRALKRVKDDTSETQASATFKQNSTLLKASDLNTTTVIDSSSSDDETCNTPKQSVRENSLFQQHFNHRNISDYPTTKLSSSVSVLAQQNRKRCHESTSFRTPVSSVRKMDMNGSFLKHSNRKPLIESFIRSAARGTFKLNSSTKPTSHMSRTILNTGPFSAKKGSSVHIGNASIILKSQSALQEAEKEKLKQEELKKQEREQAVLKKQQLLQLKVEEQKKKREERMQKNLVARQQLEKEKAQRQLSRERSREEKTSQLKDGLKNKIRIRKESSESIPTGGKLQNMKNKEKPLMQEVPLNDPANTQEKSTVEAISTASSGSISVVKHLKNSLQFGKPSEGPQDLNSTFVKSVKSSPESYKMTPQTRRSSYCNYDISELKTDDEEEEEELEDVQSSKQIPSWAVGMRLREAIYMQHYSPPDLSVIFDTVLRPELAEVFSINKARYNRRTSSAVWHQTPDRNYQPPKFTS